MFRPGSVQGVASYHGTSQAGRYHPDSVQGGASRSGTSQASMFRPDSVQGGASGIGVGTVGAVGAAAPPIFGQGVQAMPNIIMHPQYSETNTSFYQTQAQCFVCWLHDNFIVMAFFQTSGLDLGMYCSIYLHLSQNLTDTWFHCYLHLVVARTR